MDQITMLTVIQLHQWSMVLQLTAAQIHPRATATAPLQAPIVPRHIATIRCLQAATASQALPVSEPLGAYMFLEDHLNIL